MRTEQSVRFRTSNISSPKEPSDDLMEFILSEEGVSTPGRARRGELSPTMVSLSKKSLAEGDDQGDRSVLSILSKLMQDVKNLQTSKQNTSVKFAGLGISDLSDCSDWIAKHLPGHQYGLIMDPLLMLDRIYGDDEVSEGGGALLKSMELQHKMKIDSGAEAAALNALRFSRPRVFHKGRPTIVSDHSEQVSIERPSNSCGLEPRRRRRYGFLRQQDESLGGSYR